jgi:hypothetical protein
VCKPGAIVKIIVPHFSGYISWSCPEHYKTFSTGTFRYFVTGRHKFVSSIMDRIINFYFGISDRFGPLIGGISEVNTVLRVKKGAFNRNTDRVNRPAASGGH